MNTLVHSFHTHSRIHMKTRTQADLNTYVHSLLHTHIHTHTHSQGHTDSPLYIEGHTSTHIHHTQLFINMMPAQVYQNEWLVKVGACQWSCQWPCVLKGGIASCGKLIFHRHDQFGAREVCEHDEERQGDLSFHFPVLSPLFPHPLLHSFTRSPPVFHECEWQFQFK